MRSEGIRKIKHRVFEIVEVGAEGDKVSRGFDFFIISLIVLNTIMVIVDTFEIPDTLRSILQVFEIISVAIFTVEYIMRIWTADLLFSQYGKLLSRGRIISAIIAMLGIGLVAVPTGIISAGFMENIDEEKRQLYEERCYCPYCGKKIK